MGGFLFRDRFSQRSKRWRSEFSQTHLGIETLERRCMLSVNVLTWHNDLTRQGQNTNEVVLTPANVNTSIINGRVIVREGQLTTIDLGAVLERHNQLAYQLAEAAR